MTNVILVRLGHFLHYSTNQILRSVNLTHSYFSIETRNTDLVFASCWDTSRRVLICSEMTPNARKPTHARPAPSPNLLVKEVAIQSVDSTLVDEVTGLMGFCCLASLDTGGWDCGEGIGGGVGGGVPVDEEMWWVLGRGREKIGGEPKKVAMLRMKESWFR